MKANLAEYFRAAALPATLVFLFVLQNLAFNFWLGLYAHVFLLRLSLITFALGLVFYGPALLFKKKLKYFYLFLISAFVSVVFIAQFLYYRYSESFLQFSAIKYFWQIGSVFGTVMAMLSFELLVFILNIAIVFIFFYFERRQKTEFTTPLIGKIIILLAIIFVVFLGYKYLLYKEKQEWGNASRLYKDVYDLNALVSKIGTINFSLQDAAKFFLRSNLVTDADKAFLASWVKSRPAPEKGSNYFDAARGKNLIIIQIESLENSLINTVYYDQEITPNLNRLAKEGIYFDNYFAQAGPGNTADAEFSTMTSLYPLPDDVVFVNYAKNNYKALPQVLKKNGYGTYSLHGDVPTFWNRSNIYPGLGYDKMFDLSDFTVTRPVGKGPSNLGDEDFFSQSLPRLKSFKQPFMATLITMSMHTPFILPSDLQTLNLPEKTELNWLQWEYLQSAHYTDKAIGKFIDGLKKEDLYENSVIFIWGDHKSYTNIAQVLNKKDDRVPLIILNLGENSINNTPGSHLDIFPTVLNLFGIETPKIVLGQDLFNTKTPVVTQFKNVSGEIKLILTENLFYKSGKCFKIPEETSLPIQDCQNIYNQQSDALRASNIIVRGDLLFALTR